MSTNDNGEIVRVVRIGNLEARVCVLNAEESEFEIDIRKVAMCDDGDSSGRFSAYDVFELPNLTIEICNAITDELEDGLLSPELFNCLMHLAVKLGETRGPRRRI